MASGRWIYMMSIKHSQPPIPGAIILLGYPMAYTSILSILRFQVNSKRQPARVSKPPCTTSSFTTWLCPASVHHLVTPPSSAVGYTGLPVAEVNRLPKSYCWMDPSPGGYPIGFLLSFRWGAEHPYVLDGFEYCRLSYFRSPRSGSLPLSHH